MIAAITKTMSYRPRISRPSTLFASGGKKLFQIDAPFRIMRIASPTNTTAATSQPTIALVEGLVPGVDDIDCPRTRSATIAAGTVESPGGDRSRPEGRIRHGSDRAPS